jgi:hypothetical protein
MLSRLGGLSQEIKLVGRDRFDFQEFDSVSCAPSAARAPFFPNATIQL